MPEHGQFDTTRTASAMNVQGRALQDNAADGSMAGTAASRSMPGGELRDEIVVCFGLLAAMAGLCLAYKICCPRARRGTNRRNSARGGDEELSTLSPGAARETNKLIDEYA